MEGNESTVIYAKRERSHLTSHPIQNLKSLSLSFCVHTRACDCIFCCTLSSMASDAPATLKLYYWPINFRGHFIQALLRYAGVNYELAPVSELLQLKNAEPAASNPAIFMAPPLLQDGNDFFSQTPAILGYLGAKTGLAPSDLRLATVCNVVVGNCGDIINELTLQCGMKLDATDVKSSKTHYGPVRGGARSWRLPQ